MRRLVVLVTLLLAVARAACAQQNVAPSAPGAHLASEAVVKRLAGADLRALLVEAGYAIDSIASDTLVLVRLDDVRLAVALTNDGQLVHAQAAFIETKATLRTMNDWNRDNLLSRAYLDDDGDPTIETEIDIEGGVTGARLRDWLRTTRQVIAEFMAKLPR